MKISREAVVRLLREHGLETSTITGYDEAGQPLLFSSFDAELKIKPKYDKQDVLTWLGY